MKKLFVFFAFYWSISTLSADPLYCLPASDVLNLQERFDRSYFILVECFNCEESLRGTYQLIELDATEMVNSNECSSTTAMLHVKGKVVAYLSEINCQEGLSFGAHEDVDYDEDLAFNYVYTCSDGLTFKSLAQELELDAFVNCGSYSLPDDPRLLKDNASYGKWYESLD
jgi:hypothetical protein